MSANQASRSKAPVFVVGSPRSGTTLMYDMLLSAGNFAVYLTESNAFALLSQRFGDLAQKRNREKLMKVWLASKLFRASGLDVDSIERRVVQDCRNYGDFLRITMEQISASQRTERWAENTPEHLIYLPVIQATIPDVLVVHMIRDGRAVALSLDKRTDRGLRALPWHKHENLIVQGLYWEWIVNRGKSYSAALKDRYLELHFEDLIQNPRATLATLSEFIAQQLDYDLIQHVGYGSVSKPNTSFRKEPKEANFDPVSRWRKAFSSEQLETFEALVGESLDKCGYPLLTSGKGKADTRLRTMRKFYSAYFSGRFWLKNSVLAKLVRGPLTAEELDAIVMGDDHPAKLIAAPISQHSS